MNRITGLIIVAAILSILILLMTPGCDTLVTEISHDTVTIAGHPTANFTIDTTDTNSKTFGCAPLTVKFLDISDGPRNQWTWNFGDSSLSNTSDQQNPTHTYDSSGIYDVTLRIDHDSTGGTDTETKHRYIVVGATVAEFVPNPDSGCGPLLVTFFPKEYGGVDKWQWAFGDSSYDTVPFPVHTYDSVGFFLCTLTAVGDTCPDTVMVFRQIKVMGCPTAEISILDDGSYFVDGKEIVGCSPLTVYLNDDSYPGDGGKFTPANPRQWDDGDGHTSSDDSVSFVYTSSGVYWATLRVIASDASVDSSNPYWAGTDTDSIMITVSDSISAGFRSLTSAQGCSPDLPFTVYFEDTSIGNVFVRLWDFGDPNNSASGLARVESHEYSDTGHYTVQLIVGAMCGDSSDTVWDTTIVDSFVTILPVPTAGFAMDTSSGCPGLSVVFTNTSSDTISSPSWSWLINGSPAGANRDTSFTFDTLGRYAVTLVTRNGICVDSISDTVFIGPLANFTVDATSGPPGLTVTFTDLSVTPDIWDWDFGDTASASNTSTLQNPTHTFDSLGTYTVRLIVTGCGTEVDTLKVVDMIEVQ